MQAWDLTRTLRTMTSERFVLRRANADFAALDLHYGATGRCDGTLTVFDGSNLDERQIAELLREIDERLLPDFSMEERNLAFTVVFGRVMGTFQAERDPS